jgi:hypothetical protein
MNSSSHNYVLFKLVDRHLIFFTLFEVSRIYFHTDTLLIVVQRCFLLCEKAIDSTGNCHDRHVESTQRIAKFTFFEERFCDRDFKMIISTTRLSR